MKNLSLFSLILFSLLIVSCEKELKTPEAQKYFAEFHISAYDDMPFFENETLFGESINDFYQNLEKNESYVVTFANNVVTPREYYLNLYASMSPEDFESRDQVLKYLEVI